MAIRYHKKDRLIEMGIEESAILLGKAKSTVEGYLKKGLQQHLVKQKPRTLNAALLIAWYIENEIASPDKMKVIESEVRLKEARENKLNLEIRQMEGELISIEDYDESVAQLAALLVSQYRQLREVLPPLLQRKTSGEIGKVLDEFFETNIKDLHALAVAEEEVFQSRYEDEDDDDEQTSDDKTEA